MQLESKYEGVAPKLVLLSLLAECCMVTTTQTQVRGHGHVMHNIYPVDDVLTVHMHMHNIHPI